MWHDYNIRCSYTILFVEFWTKLPFQVNYFFKFPKPRKKRRSVLLEEDDTDEEYEEKDSDFEMGPWSLQPQDAGTFILISSHPPIMISHDPNLPNWIFLLYMNLPPLVSDFHFQSPSSPGPDGVSRAEKLQADKEAAWAKTLKSVSWPEMDDDALPSSYVQKVLNCLGKWQLKMGQLQNTMGDFEPEPTIDQ